MSNVTIFDWNSTVFLIIIFTVTLLFIIVLFKKSRDNNDKGFDYDRACPDCHRLLKKEWKNCPFCGHKEKE